MSRLGTQEGSSQTESKYQYQRAYALSRDLKDQILDYSNSQLHQLQSSSALVYVYAFRPLPSVFDTPRANFRQRATETAKSIQNLASSGVVAAQAKVGTLSDTMVTELQKVQVRRICIPNFFRILLICAGCDCCSSSEPAGIIQARAGKNVGRNL